MFIFLYMCESAYMPARCTLSELKKGHATESSLLQVHVHIHAEQYIYIYIMHTPVHCTCNSFELLSITEFMFLER